MKALVDTCVILDVLQARKPFLAHAREVFLAVASGRAEGFIAAHSVTDIHYLLRRHLHSEAETRAALSKLVTLFAILDTAGTDCRRALISEMKDYEDAIVAETALRSGMGCIVTRNLADYQAAKVPVHEPKEFLEIIAR